MPGYLHTFLSLFGIFVEFFFLIFSLSLFAGHFYLGSCLLELDKVDESLKHLQTAFELAKKDPGSYYDDTSPSKLRSK